MRARSRVSLASFTHVLLVFSAPAAGDARAAGHARRLVGDVVRDVTDRREHVGVALAALGAFPPVWRCGTRSC